MPVTCCQIVWYPTQHQHGDYRVLWYVPDENPDGMKTLTEFGNPINIE